MRDALPWILGAGGLAGALGLFIFLRPVVGTKIAGFLAAAVAAFGLYQGAQSRARNQGRRDERDEARRRAEDAIRTGDEAERAERERQRREGTGTARPDDPYVVDRHTGRLPDDGRNR